MTVNHEMGVMLWDWSIRSLFRETFPVLEGLKKTINILGQNSWPAGRQLNLWPKYECPYLSNGVVLKCCKMKWYLLCLYSDGEVKVPVMLKLSMFLIKHHAMHL